MYSQNLAGKTYLYVYGNEYFEVSFPIDHFLHLTGVETRLSAKDFYKNAKKKLPCLKRLHARKDRLLLARFAAGAMLYVEVEKLIPEMSQGQHLNIGTLFFALGYQEGILLQ